MEDLIEKYNWGEWKPFPDPRNGEYLFAPFGYGVYQLRNIETNEFVLFGSSNNLAFRMSSLLPKPLGQGTRKKEEKRIYILNNLSYIEYRTVAFLKKEHMTKCERILKNGNNHLFNS
jgi:hypothetical protein